MCGLYYFKDMSWLHFAKRKSEMVKFVSYLLAIFKGERIKVECIRYDNSDEHMSKLRALCHKKVVNWSTHPQVHQYRIF